MNTIYKYILLAILFLVSFLTLGGEGFAAFWVTDPEYASPYCTSGNCSLEGGNSIVQTILPWLGTTKTATEYVTDVILYFLSFVTLIAVIYVIYAGFQLMTGGWDEEKTKKAKKIVFWVIIGIVLMWLAYSIVSIIVTAVQRTVYDDSGKHSSLIAELFGIPTASAYTESDQGTFDEYKKRLVSIAMDIETEFRTNGLVSANTIGNTRSLVNLAYQTLPDRPDDQSANEGLKRSVDLYLGLVERTPGSTSYVTSLVQSIREFIDRSKIGRISATIEANPSTGNAPLTVTFQATNVSDPSGVRLLPENYIWWIREAGGGRRELGRGPTLAYTFASEQSYTVFLDVVSASRNSKWRVDVLPFSGEKKIEVLPRVGDIILFINGVNVSDLSTFKVSPAIARAGLLLDATASRGSNGTVIQKTIWKFGNDNEISYNGGPQIERQIYANEGKYTLSLDMTNNQWKTFHKDLSIVVVDPASVIQLDRDIGHIGEDFHFSALSYFATSNNIRYQWDITDLDLNRRIHSSEEVATNYTFSKIGKYAITLTARNANGKTDVDTRIVTIESRDPVANLEAQSSNPETPNIFSLDASRSLDPDTSSSKWLSYIWKIDGQTTTLDRSDTAGARWSHTFSTLGEHTISLTVSNSYGKISTIEKKVVVSSLLSVALDIRPLVIQIGRTVHISATAPAATFYEWSINDGSPNILGAEKSIEHSFQRSGAYDVSLQIRSADGKQTNSITRKVYATDTDHPFALILARDGGGNLLQETANTCNGNPAFIIDRAQTTQIDGGSSVNVDGTNNGLIYSWKYNGKSYTTSSISQKFEELGCFPIELTVKSQKNGATSSMKKYISIANLPPRLASVTSTINSSSKTNTSSQKVIVDVSANAARDEDGVIVSYLWYYYTDSDREPQGVKITQSPKTTFVVPNITEKYYFGVILEDNDGAKTNSLNSITDSIPLVISNDNGNINIPLISLTVSSTNVKAGETVNFEARAKTILGKDITKDCTYYWDFAGDGVNTKKTTDPKTTFTYQSAGTMSMKVKVLYNGVSNTKYQTIYVKNELSPNVRVARIGSRIFVTNTSGGYYESAKWIMGDFSSTSLGGVTYDFWDEKSLPRTGTLEITDGDGVSKNIDFPIATIDPSPLASSGSIEISSFPEMQGDTITVDQPNTKVSIGLFQNSATRYVIDEDTHIDSDLDGIADNDEDNSNDDSYTTGAPYTLSTLASSESREKTLKISLYQGNTLIGSRLIKVARTYLPAINTASSSGSGSIATPDDISTLDKNTMDRLATEIRTLDSEDRTLLMQKYNLLVDNWQDTTEKTKIILDMQEYIDSSGIGSTEQTKLGDILSTLIAWENKASDTVLVATSLIRNLVPSDHPQKAKIDELLATIESHPTNLTENKKLANEINAIIKDDTIIDLKYREAMYQQLKVIVSGGDEVTGSGATTETKTTLGGSIVGFVSGFVKIAFLVIAGLFVILILAFIWYSVSNKNDHLGFQDFIIDSIFHGGRARKSALEKTTRTTPAPVIDPLGASLLSTPIIETTLIDPLQTTPSHTEFHPDAEVKSWAPLEQADGSIPDWLKVADSTHLDPAGETTTLPEQNTEATPAIEVPIWLSESSASPPSSGEIDWTSPDISPLSSSETRDTADTQTIDPVPTESAWWSSTTSDATLPSWLQPDTSSTTIEVPTPSSDHESVPPSWDTQDWEVPLENTQQVPTPESAPSLLEIPDTSLPDTITKDSSLPAWLQDEVSTSTQANNLEEKDTPVVPPETVWWEISITPSVETTSTPSEAVTPQKSEIDTLPDWLRESHTEMSEAKGSSQDETPMTQKSTLESWEWVETDISPAPSSPKAEDSFLSTIAHQYEEPTELTTEATPPSSIEEAKSLSTDLPSWLTTPSEEILPLTQGQTPSETLPAPESHETLPQISTHPETEGQEESQKSTPTPKKSEKQKEDGTKSPPKSPDTTLPDWLQ